MVSLLSSRRLLECKTPSTPTLHKLRRPTTVVLAQKRSPVLEGLSTVLKDELKIEKERYRTPDALLEGPPSGYELDDKPNSNMLLLSRSFGGEEIYVEVELESQADSDEYSDVADDEEEDEESYLPPVRFIVNVVKGDKGLAFTCETNGREITITQVSLNDTADEEAEDDDSNFVPYTGPMFDELDDTLQQAFIDYLEERGITSDFGYYLVELVNDKLEVEYMNWLTRVQSFVVDE
eukprot:GHUV01002599.1.p1 GENE.GHUV01002599.1~~GHUV01002599.1.p1  ORF type:complete len:236 (+),score=57.93 GHUV01002599.1:175-882(+)